MSIDLDPFRTAKTLVWVRHTGFQPGGGADGDLVADGHRLVLDVVTRDESTASDMYPPFTADMGVWVAEPSALDDLHEAVRCWCAWQLGRDDVEFPQ